eukprot:5537-Pyramimonas_sp.AAC.1
MLRLLRANRMFSRFEARRAINYSMLQLYMFLVMLFMLCHWLACGWLVACPLHHRFRPLHLRFRPLEKLI